MKIPFGKFKGCALEDLPDDYLTWLLSIELREALHSAVESERERRIFSQECTGIVNVKFIDEVVTAGVRALARRYHPDTANGSHQAMISINAAADWIRSQARVLE